MLSVNCMPVSRLMSDILRPVGRVVPESPDYLKLELLLFPLVLHQLKPRLVLGAGLGHGLSRHQTRREGRRPIYDIALPVPLVSVFGVEPGASPRAALLFSCHG